MQLSLIYYGDSTLRKKCHPIPEITLEIKELVENMIETMDANNGIGIAAPQVGHLLRIFITRIPMEDETGEVIEGPLKVYINPKILEFSKKKSTMSEGCLSIPKLHCDVIRPIEVEITATGLDGDEFTEKLTGLSARCFLHENDHINGVLFIDRLDKKERKDIEIELRKIKKNYFEKSKKS